MNSSRAKEKIDVAPTKRKVTDALRQSSDKDDFVAKLKERNIDVVFRYTDEGRIYGVTFVDHDTMTALNGSRLGKEFSANALNARFSHQSQPTEQTPTATVVPILTPTNTTSGVNRHHLPELHQLLRKVNLSTATAEITTSHCRVLTCSSQGSRSIPTRKNSAAVCSEKERNTPQILAQPKDNPK